MYLRGNIKRGSSKLVSLNNQLENIVGAKLGEALHYFCKETSVDFDKDAVAGEEGIFLKSDR